MLNTLLSLVTAAHVAVAPVKGPAQYACVRVNLTQNVQTQTGLSAYDVQQSVIAQLQGSGWTATAVGGGVNGWDCNSPIIFAVTGAATWTTGEAGDTTFSFAILVSAYEKMTSQWKPNYWWYAEHHDQVGAWTSEPTLASGRTQFMAGVTDYINLVRAAVELD